MNNCVIMTTSPALIITTVLRCAMAYHRPGRKIATDKSSIASGYSTPSFSARRFDHLIGEQQTLVRNAQEALKQSLSIFQRGSSKEEQDSARLQVDALLTRCGELLTKLQVVTTIRKELAATQSEITDSRRRRKGNVTELQHRQQWLEKRLQGLLLSRYRGRPAARGRRAVLPAVNRAGTQDGGRMAESKADDDYGVMEEQPQRANGRGLKPGRFIGRVLAHQRHQSNVTTISDITTGYTMSIPSSAGHVMKDSDDDSETDSQMSSDEFSNDGASSTTEHRIVQDSSTKKQEDSDEWHSESEANWTIMDVQSKQVTPSQPCSSNEEDRSQTIKPLKSGGVPCIPLDSSYSRSVNEETTNTRVFERVEISSQQTGSATDPWYGFERPRLAKLFGPESWNTLSLARFTNYVEPRSSAKRKSHRIIIVDLVELVEEVAALSEQVQAVAKAVVEGGRTAPPSRGLQRSVSVAAGGIRRSRTGSARASTTAESSNITFKLPPLKQNKLGRITFRDADSMYEPSGATGRPSRKIFAKEGMEQIYPQPVSRWNKVQTADCLLKDQPTLIQMEALPYYSKGQKQRSTRKKANTTSNHIIEDQIAFEAEKHRAQRLQLLTERLSSSITDVRADTVQALGCLSPDQDIIQAMMKMLVKDPQPQVRFEALKSLIKIGIIDNAALKIMTVILKNGTVFCQYELLSVLGTDNAIMCLKQNITHDPDVQQGLHDVLLHLMMDSSCDQYISISASNILSLIGVYKSTCKEYLITNCLKSKNSLYQYNALCYLTDHHDIITDEMVDIAFSHINTLPDWKQRLRAVNILKSAGSAVINCSTRDTVQEKLMKRLPNEPIIAVRKSIGELIGKLKMTEQVEAKVQKKLEKGDEVERRQAIVSLAALQLKERSILNILLDSLELDPSVHVKVQAVRVLSTFQPPSSAVLSCLQRKAQGTGTLARESSRALLILSDS